jgi:hypothetical protein
MITLEQIKRAFPKGNVRNGEYLAHCPIDRHKGKPKLSITEENGKVLVRCHACGDSRKDAVWQAVVTRVQQVDSATPGELPLEPGTDEPKAWPSWLPQYPTDWQPISQESRDAIAAKRRDYTPTFETLRATGVVETKGKFVAFPCRVGGELRNLRVLDFTKPKEDWDYLQYRPGPEPGTRIAPDKAVMFSPQPLELMDPFEPVFIVEGQWDAITMHEHGFSCVSLLSAGQPLIAPDVLDYLSRAECIYFAYDNDGGAGLMAAQRLAPLLPSDRTFLFPWADWSVKDACELRSRCESADQFKQEISSLIDRIEDTEKDRDANPEHYEYLDKLEKWDGNGPAPQPDAPQTPGMGDEAFHGIAGNYIRSLKGNSEASQEGMLVLFLSAFSSMAGYRAWTRVEETVHYPNLFAIIAGKSSRARKDTGYNRIIKPLKEADATWASECCKSHFASGEALAEYWMCVSVRQRTQSNLLLTRNRPTRI